jgi:hypothetical protein
MARPPTNTGNLTLYIRGLDSKTAKAISLMTMAHKTNAGVLEYLVRFYCEHGPDIGTEKQRARAATVRDLTTRKVDHTEADSTSTPKTNDAGNP